jgi:hypothetical protein
MARDSERQRNNSIEKNHNPRNIPPARIETQIHRRSKAKAVFPLEAEWQVGADYPLNLKMPADKMDKHRNAGS